MLFRIHKDLIRFCPRLMEEGNREGKNFFIWIRCSPLKRPDSPKESKEMQAFSLFCLACVYLDAKPNRRQRALSLSDFGAEPDNCVDCRLGLVQLRRVAAGLKD